MTVIQAKPGKVGIFTMTRDRLDFTKRALPSMWSKAGAKYEHWVFDQGSMDGTLDWLNEAHESGNIHKIVELGENKGLHIGMNTAHETLLDAGYSYIVKVDNDMK
jgi:GT2 family glycosyltransferase